jgi:GNAT superfamily N-acetyltransferase
MPARALNGRLTSIERRSSSKLRPLPDAAHVERWASQTGISALPRIRKLQPPEWARYRAVRLRSLADAPDAFGGTFAAEQARTDEAWQAQLIAAAASGEDHPLVAEHGGEAIGLAWAKVEASDNSAVNVFQMWVAPQHRRRGIGSELLVVVIGWARSRNARSVQLGVTCGDSSASRLYFRKGFEAFGPEKELRPGSEFKFQSMRLVLREAGA